MENKFHGQFGEVLVIKDLFDDFDIPKTCIEFGAYDGITNSNTYYFWKKKGFKALLIMHGEDDFLISPKEAELNHKNLGSEIKILEILKGVGHNDMMMAPEYAYFKILKRFFDSL